MALTFYGAPMSTAVVTEAVLAELGIPFERVTIAIGPEGTRHPDFLAVNPNGRVPAIVHDGVAIWESAAITLYLGEAFGGECGLYPPPGPARGEAMKWIVWTNVVLAEAGGRLAATLDGPGGAQPESPDWVAPGARDPRAGERARTDIAAALRILDSALDGRAFICGEYGLADTHLSVFVGWLGMMGTDLAAVPNVAAWAARCAARPALAALFRT